jgi:hypothetical protein
MPIAKGEAVLRQAATQFTSDRQPSTVGADRHQPSGRAPRTTVGAQRLWPIGHNL